jgi:ABC-type branched-subunit amino acid transport system substrate-binding protein
MKDLLSLCLVPVIILLAQAFTQRPVWADDSCDSIRVAFNVPLSGSLSTYGSAIQEGVVFAAESLPKPKVSIQYDWEDNQSETKGAVAVLRKQLLSSPTLYVSGVKPQYMAIRDAIVRSGLPHFPWIFDVNIRPNKERNFRTWVNFKIEPPLFLEYVAKMRPKKIAIVYVQLPSTDEEYLEHVIPGLKAAGFTDLKVEPYQMDKTDFRDLALRVRGFAPDLLILSGFQGNFVGMIKAFNAQNLIRGKNAVATYDLLDAAPLLRPGEIEGLRVAMPKFLLEADNPRISQWIDAFEKRFHKKPLYTHAYAYDMAKIIMSGANRLGLSCSPDRLYEVLATTSEEGITGKLKFDEQGDLPPSVALGVFRNGIAVAE